MDINAMMKLAGENDLWLETRVLIYINQMMKSRQSYFCW